MTVVVESDDAAAWIGIVGVAVGSLLTAGLEWLRSRRGQYDRRRRELLVAGYRLERNARALMMSRQLMNTAAGHEPISTKSALEWTTFLDPKIAALDAAAEVIIAQGSPALIEATHRVTALAFLLEARSPDQEGKANRAMTDAVDTFCNELAKLTGASYKGRGPDSASEKE